MSDIIWTAEEINHIETIHATALMLEGERVTVTWTVYEAPPAIAAGAPRKFQPRNMSATGVLSVRTAWDMRALTDEHGRDDWIEILIDDKSVGYIDSTTWIERHAQA